MKRLLLLMTCLTAVFSAKAQIYNVVPPQSTTVCADSPFTLTVSADGENLEFAWFHNNVQIADVSTPSYSVVSASSIDNGFYYCKISSGSDNVFTTSAQVTVNSMPVIITQPVQSAQACEGSFFQPYIYAEGNNLAYQWFHDDDPIEGATTNGLNVFPVTPGDAGEYHCIVSSGNCFSATSGSVMMQVTPSLGEFEDVTQCGNFTLPPLQTPGAQYWTGQEGTGIQLFPGDVISTTMQVYVYLPNAGSCDNQENFVVTITNGFTAAMTPEGDTLSLCDNVIMNLHVTVTTQLPLFLSYQWSQNGVPIAGATDNDLPVSGPGVYSCAVSAGCGNPTMVTKEIVASDQAINQVPSVTTCSNPSQTVVLDLSGLASQIVGQSQISVKFYDNLDNAEVNNAEDFMSLNGNLQYLLVQTVTIYARVDAPGTPGCVWVFPVQLILEDCTQTNNSISGTIRLDADNNGCTNDDEPAAGITVVRVTGNNTYYTYTDNSGHYSFANVAEGQSYVYVYGASLPQFCYVASPTTNNGGYMFEVSGEGNTLTGDFCIAVPQPVTNAQVYLFAYGNSVPGFQASYAVNVVNAGTMALSGAGTVTFDTAKLDFLFSLPAGVTQTGNTLHFNIDPIQPLQGQIFYLYFNVKAPPIVNSGDVLAFTANANTVNTDVDLYDNTASLNQTVLNSFDPNDIACQQGPEIIQEQVDEDLIYTIRCQNTGTADAVNIRITTTLDDKLDWDTFRPVLSDHAYAAERIGNEVTFRFNDINLPPASVDEAGSNGFIMYRVKAKPTLAIGDVIAATADIFFDFNAAITTNTATTELVEPLGIGSNDMGFAMHPNPAGALVRLHLDGLTDASVSVGLFDLQGKKIIETHFIGNEGMLDVSKIQAGVYFVRITSGDRSAVRKLIVK